MTYHADKRMDEKTTTVKNLSWRDGFVSSIDGVTISESCENKKEQHQELVQRNLLQLKQSTLPILKAPIEGQRNFTIPRRIYTADIKSHPCTSSSPAKYLFSDTCKEEKTDSGMENPYSAMVSRQWGSANNNDNKENARTYEPIDDVRRSGIVGGNSLSLFEEEYQRKYQLMRSNAKKKDDTLYVILNRKAGVITHVIRTNPRYNRK